MAMNFLVAVTGLTGLGLTRRSVVCGVAAAAIGPLAAPLPSLAAGVDCMKVRRPGSLLRPIYADELSCCSLTGLRVQLQPCGAKERAAFLPGPIHADELSCCSLTGLRVQLQPCGAKERALLLRLVRRVLRAGRPARWALGLGLERRGRGGVCERL